jgi:hypothetical protein
LLENRTKIDALGRVALLVAARLLHSILSAGGMGAIFTQPPKARSKVEFVQRPQKIKV